MSGLIKCLDCTDPPTFYRFAKEMEAHIAAEHLNWLPYRCRKCVCTWLPTEYALHKHYAEVHEDMDYIQNIRAVSSNDDKLQKQLKEKLRRCVEASNIPRISEQDKIQWNVLPDLRCLYCPGVFNYKEVLEAHIAEIHLSLRRLYQCKICEYVKFPTEKTLVKHYMSDHQLPEFDITKPFSPEIVEKQKILAEKLAFCISAYKQRYPTGHVMCAMCKDLMEKTDNAMTYHADLHARLPFYVCRHCPVTFFGRVTSKIKDHIRDMHKNVDVGDYEDYMGDVGKVKRKCFPLYPNPS